MVSEINLKNNNKKLNYLIKKPSNKNVINNYSKKHHKSLPKKNFNISNNMRLYKECAQNVFLYERKDRKWSLLLELIRTKPNWKCIKKCFIKKAKKNDDLR